MTLHKYLTLVDLSHAKFGKMIGISATSVGNYARFDRIPPLDVAIKIWKVTKGLVSLEELLSDK